MGKSRLIGGGERVGAVVARGEAEIGFQQLSELLPVDGIDHVTPLPAEVQKVTVFSAGVAVTTGGSNAAHAVDQVSLFARRSRRDHEKRIGTHRAELKAQGVPDVQIVQAVYQSIGPLTFINFRTQQPRTNPEQKENEGARHFQPIIPAVEQWDTLDAPNAYA